MKKIIKSKIFLVIICGIIFTGLGVYGASIYNSRSILYTTSNGESMSVEDALNELYENSCSSETSETEEHVFDYTGNEQIFTVSKTGTYKLEVWGAQGGNATNNYIGGYGGYSVGEIKLTKDDVLYINVGGKGQDSAGGSYYYSVKVTGIGGYNGGANTKYNNDYHTSYIGAGGGATHIATKSGLLSTLSSSIDNILIVSGGGGGANYWLSSNSNWDYGIGGSAGGFVGNSGSTSANKVSGTGGTQTTGGTYNASFGQGGVYNVNVGSAGGGGGFYGGGGSYDNAGGGGGSSYIGNSLLTNKSMYCYNCTPSDEVDTKTYSTACTNSDPTENCSKQGNGYAKITYLGK